MHFKFLATVLVTTAVAGSFALATPAQAGPTGQAITKCGQTLTTGKAYLAKNLTCSTGFTITAPEGGRNVVTLDLRGHRLQGKGTNAAFSVQGDGENSVGLTVSNGRVDHWNTAFSGSFAAVTVTKVYADHNNLAMGGSKTGCSISTSVLSYNKLGTGAADGSIVVDHTLFSHNDTGMVAMGGTSAQQAATNSVFKANHYGVQAIDTSSSIDLRNNLFTGNTVGVLGGYLDHPGDFQVTVTGNTFIKNHDGIFLNGWDPYTEPITVAEVSKNVAYHNSRYGIFVRLAPGLSADGGGNRAWKNGKPCVGVVCATK